MNTNQYAFRSKCETVDEISELIELVKNNTVEERKKTEANSFLTFQRPSTLDITPFF